MQVKYKGILGIISFLLLITFVIGISYLFYDGTLSSDDYLVFVNDELSINYLYTNMITDSKEYKFSITNTSSNEVYYEINLVKDALDNKDITYDLNSEEANIKINEALLNHDDLNSVVNKSLGAHETHNYTIKIANNTSNIKIEVKKIETLTDYFAQTILKNNEIVSSGEGLYQAQDDYGDTYYFRGNVINNYVSVNDTLWRIVRINGDNTVRLVLDNLLEDVHNYHNSLENYEEFPKTSIYQNLETFFNLYLVNNSHIANSKFCQEKEKDSSSSDITYNAYKRISIDNIPTFNCLGTKYLSKFGLLNADEVAYSIIQNESGLTSYLINPDIATSWWTSTLALANTTSFTPFSITPEGKIDSTKVGSEYLGIRPVINLNRKTIVTGSGTIDNPYILLDN